MERFILICVGIIGAMITYFVSNQLRQGGIRASALLSFVVAGFFYLFPDILPYTLTKQIPLVFIGSTFIGMVSPNQLSSYIGIGLAGLLYSLIYIKASSFFNGYGGALGTAACVSLLVIMCTPYLKSPRKLTFGLFRIKKAIFRDKK